VPNVVFIHTAGHHEMKRQNRAAPYPLLRCASKMTLNLVGSPQVGSMSVVYLGRRASVPPSPPKLLSRAIQYAADGRRPRADA
jgi:hypothetical protein